jgi:hypothetical protein
MNALLVFSYDTSNPLNKLKEELARVQSLIQTPTFVPASRWQCDSEQIRQFFDDYREKVRLFHFGGHALGKHLQLNDSLEPMRLSFADALAARICQYGGLRLVFLNGCSTQHQAEAFLNQGVGAVIYTQQPLRDKYALYFSRLFYQEFCRNNKPLQTAFNDTLTGFLADNQAQQSDWLEPELEVAKRGFVTGEEEEDSLYLLRINPAHAGIAAETFRDWQQPAVAALAQINQREQAQVKSIGVDANSYLLCNRRKEAETFSTRTLGKLNGKAQDPLFFFIHDKDLHCPYELGLRFKEYGLPNALPPRWQEIELESLEGQFFDGDKYKLALSELYARHFPGSFNAGLNRWVLQKLQPDNNLVIVYHDLSVLEWEDGWNALFQYYTREYALQLSQELSSRLIVICLREYYEDADSFGALFDQLAVENAASVASFSQLPEIRKSDIGSWQKEVFQETFFLVNDLFTSDDGQTLNSLPFIKAKQKLSDKIKEFNRTKVS